MGSLFTRKGIIIIIIITKQRRQQQQNDDGDDDDSGECFSAPFLFPLFSSSFSVFLHVSQCGVGYLPRTAIDSRP